MTVGVFHAATAPTPHLALAARLITSVRRSMPSVEVVQLTTHDSLRLTGVDRVIEVAPGPVALACLDAYAACIGEWLFVDSDVLVQEDVRPVFERPFYVSVASRAGTLKACEVGTQFMARMPFNKGAVFSRSPAFWQDARARCAEMKPGRQAWMGDQQAMNDTIASGRFLVSILPGRYNYPPMSRDENLSGQAICHFKGPRKAWMLERAA